MTNLEKAESLLNMLVESNPDHAERLLESMLAKIELRKRLATKRAQAEPVQEPYTIEEIRNKIASHDYNAELLLQHAMLHVERMMHQAETAQPKGWLYESATGFIMVHIVGHCNEASLQADKNAARDYPTGHKITPLYTAPQPVQRKPLTEEEKQTIHNETGAGHSLICLVESYINSIKEVK